MYSQAKDFGCYAEYLEFEKIPQMLKKLAVFTNFLSEQKPIQFTHNTKFDLLMKTVSHRNMCINIRRFSRNL